MEKNCQETKGPSKLLCLCSNETPFLMIFTCYAVLSWLGPVTEAVRFLAYPLAIWAALLLVSYTIRFGFSYLRFVALGLGMAASYCLTVFLNAKFSPLGEQLQSVIWIFVFAVLLYGVAFRRDRLRKNIRLVTSVFVLLIFICSLISLVTYYAQVQPFLLQPDGSYILLGFFNERLFGIYRDPNYGAVLAVLALGLSLYYFLFEKKCPVKTIFLLLNALVQIMYLALSYSRTGQVVLVVMLLLFIPANYNGNKKLKKKPGRLQSFTRLGLHLALCVILVLAVKYPFWTLYDSVPDTPELPSSKAAELATDSTDKGKEIERKKEETEREKVVHKVKLRNEEEAKASSQERLDLMKEALQLLQRKPVFGTGDRNIQPVAKAYLPDSLLAQGWVPHNGYLFVLLTNGILGAGLLFFRILLSFIHWLKNFRRGRSFNVEGWLLGVPVLVLGVSALFLQDLFNTMSPGALLFWLFLGACSVAHQPAQQPEAGGDHVYE